MYIAGPVIPLLGLGLMQMESDQSPMALVPFVLLALLTVVVMLAVYGAAREDSWAPVASEPYWPKSRLGVLAYLMGLFLFPAALVMGVVISFATEQWLAAGVMLAMVIPPLLLRLDALAEGRRLERGGQEHPRRR